MIKLSGNRFHIKRENKISVNSGWGEEVNYRVS